MQNLEFTPKRTLTSRKFIKAAGFIVLSLTGCASPATPEAPTSTPTVEDIARQLSQAYGAEIRATNPNKADYGLPVSAQELTERIKAGTMKVALYNLGSRTEDVMQFFQLQKDDTLHPGQKRNLIMKDNSVVNGQQEMPAWVQGLVEENDIAVTITVSQKDDDGWHRTFLGVRPGILSGMNQPTCDLSFGCQEEQVTVFIDQELGKLVYFTQDESGLMP